mgnify:CR=1 FL=1
MNPKYFVINHLPIVCVASNQLKSICETKT